MPPHENDARRLLERLHAAVNAHDAMAVAALCHEQVSWQDPAAAEPLHGREAVYRFHHRTMFRALPDVRVELVEGPYFAADGARVAVRLRMRGTMSGPLDPPGFGPTGEEVVFETAEFSEVQGGLLVRHHVVLDMLALARQIGAVPDAGSGAERAGIWLQRFRAWLSRHQLDR